MTPGHLEAETLVSKMDEISSLFAPRYVLNRICLLWIYLRVHSLKCYADGIMKEET